MIASVKMHAHVSMCVGMRTGRVASRQEVQVSVVVPLAKDGERLCSSSHSAGTHSTYSMHQTQHEHQACLQTEPAAQASRKRQVDAAAHTNIHVKAV